MSKLAEAPQDLKEIIQLIPGYDPTKDAGDSVFDEESAERAIGFFEEILTHVKGKCAGELFKLEGWQKAIIANLFGWKLPNGRRRYREVFIYVPRKNGKMLDLDTVLPTPRGWTTMREVKTGDTLFDERGATCRVVATSEIDESPDSYSVKFSNGEEVKACADHQWLTTVRVRNPGCWGGLNKKAPLTQVRTTLDIFKTQHYGRKRLHNHRMPMPAELYLPKRNLLVDPYLLGCWLGDGTSIAARFTCGVPDVPHFQKEFWRSGCGIKPYRQQGDRAPQFGIKTLQPGLFGPVAVSKSDERNLCRKLRRLGVLSNKHIPCVYLRSSAAQRLALLQGLMDTDGSADIGGRKLRLATVIPALRDGFGELLASLGVKYTCREEPSLYRGRETNTAYLFQFFVSPDVLPVFRMPRKLSRVRQPTRSAQPSRSVMIKSVTKCDPVPMKCISVDSPSGLYRFGRTMLPTHNTTIAAGIPLYVLFCDPEAGKEIYVAAADREQAGILFGIAQQMVLNEWNLDSRCTVLKKSITREDKGCSFFKSISKDANTKHGYNASVVVVDELHAQPDRELVDVLETSTGSREQPIFVSITTADFDRPSICNEKHQYAKDVRDGEIDDPAFLPVIYEPDPGDDWRDRETWKKVNPNLGVSLQMDYMERKFQKAISEPIFENTFKRLHLNIKTQTDIQWLSIDQWDLCNGEVNRGDLYGETCYAGLDLANTEDVAAFVLFFPESFQVIPFFFTPRGTAEKRERKSKGKYLTWSRKKLMELTSGSDIDHDYIEERIKELSEEFNIVEIGYDRWNSHSIVKHLKAVGFKMTPVGQGYASLSSPMKDLERLVISKRLLHDGNEVLRWMAGNVMVEEDAAGNFKPSRAKSSDKIDGIVALIVAIACANLDADEQNVYSERGFLRL